MKTQWVVVTIAMLSYLLYQYINGGPGNLTVMRAADGDLYKVQDLPHKQEAVEMMSKIMANLEKPNLLDCDDYFIQKFIKGKIW